MSGTGLNRIPAALGHVIPSTLAFFTPLSGESPNANEIDSLYKIILVVAAVVFVGVWGALGYALVRFRKRKGAVQLNVKHMQSQDTLRNDGGHGHGFDQTPGFSRSNL